METKPRKRYPTEFQIQALELARELKSLSAAARQLGISDSLIYSWRTKHNFDIGNTSRSAATAVAETEEMKHLRKENEELKKVNNILRKAAAFFSQDHLK